MATKVRQSVYRVYGYIYQAAESVAAGAREAGGTVVDLLQIRELVPDNILEKGSAASARAACAHLPIGNPDQLERAEVILFGKPTRFDNMRAQMHNFLEQTREPLMKGGLRGNVGSVFASTASQDGGPETSITSFHSTPLRPRMIDVSFHIRHGVDFHGRDERRLLLRRIHHYQRRRLATRKGACDRCILRSTVRCCREKASGRIVVGEQIVGCCKRYVRLALDHF